MERATKMEELGNAIKQHMANTIKESEELNEIIKRMKKEKEENEQKLMEERKAREEERKAREEERKAREETEQKLKEATEQIRQLSQPKSSVKPELIPTDCADLQNLKKRFKSEYIGNQSLELLSSHIRTNWNKVWNYFPICQSSGYGKSRLIKELALNPKYRTLNDTTSYTVVYLCLRDKRSSGYPIGNSVIRNWFHGLDRKDSNVVEQEMKDFISRWSTYVYMKKRNIKDKHWWDLMENADKKTMQECLNTDISTSLSDSPKLLFVIDEARILLKWSAIEQNNNDISHFRCWRRAIKCFPNRVFSILIDTSCRVSNFSKPLENDPSARNLPTEPSPSDLILPFYSILTSQVYKNKNGPTNDDTLLAFQIGRPLWIDTIISLVEKQCILSDIKAHLVNFGKLKLSNGEDINSKGNAALACWGVLIHLGIAPISTVHSDSLVADHMSTLIGISPHRDMLFTKYLSEPVLAEAALQLLHDSLITNKICYAKDLLVDWLKIGVVDSGTRCEISVRIILILTLLTSYSRSYFSDRWKLTHFLRGLTDVFDDDDLKPDAFDDDELMPDACDDDDVMPDAQRNNIGDLRIPQNAEICFTHFYPFEAPLAKLTKNMLAQCFKRRTALTTFTNQVAVDMVIPLSYIEDGEEKYGLIAIQVKNRLKASKPLILFHGINRTLLHDELKNIYILPLIFDLSCDANKAGNIQHDLFLYLSLSRPQKRSRTEDRVVRTNEKEHQMTTRATNKQEHLYGLSFTGLKHIKGIKGHEEFVSDIIRPPTIYKIVEWLQGKYVDEHNKKLIGSISNLDLNVTNWT